jgi:Fe-S cluster biogenesis protein NfuA
MTPPPDADDFRAKLHRLESLVREAERLADPAARRHARELAHALLDLHATGLERLLDCVADAGETGGAILDSCASDDVVSGLLLLHGLHPLGAEDRVRLALEDLRPRLRSHGVALELLGVDEGAVRLRLDGGCGCGSSAAAIRQAVEEAVTARAPETLAVEIDGLEAIAEEGGRVALPVL